MRISVEAALRGHATRDAHIYLQDANFNVTAVADNTGAVIERYSYTPYGEVTFLDSSFITQNSSLINNKILYTGRRRDPETHLQLNRNRFYHALLGRWLNRDPIGYDGGYNLYEYVNSKPTIGRDPEGTDCPGCDLPAWIGADGSDCVTNCCFEHDKCYYDNDCTAWSWVWNAGAVGVGACIAGPLGGAGGWSLVGVFSECGDCNKDVVDCIAACGLGLDLGPARYFCAKLGREVTIGIGPNFDFPTLAAAKAACCT